ncbi:MAG: GNAT family N-acetyltransferase [Desulfobacterales bacterium]|nr:GNAT family N-acetyltransferase [Desulfobacterales bacterium]
MDYQEKKEMVDIGSVNITQAYEIVSFRNSYHGTDRKAEDWIWEYAFFAPSKAVFCVQRNHSELIATQAMMPFYLKIDSKIVLTGKSENTLLLPEYRGKKIMSELYEYAVSKCNKHNMAFIWGFTPAVKAFQRWGFETYPIFQTLEKPGLNLFKVISSKLTEKRLLFRHFGSIGKYLIKYFANINHIGIPEAKQNDNYSILSEPIEETSLNDLYDRLRVKFPDIITLHYDERFLNWRIREHPFLKYQEYQVKQGNELRAYALVVLSKGVLHISDLTSEDSTATSVLLFKILKDYYKKAGKFTIIVNPTDTIAQDLIKQLKSNGFVPNPPVAFVLRILSFNKAKLLKAKPNWHINGLWTEGFLA